MHYKWMPVQGEFEIEDSLIVFKGKPVTPNAPATGEAPVPAKLASLGVCLCNVSMANGFIRADVTLASTEFASCEMLLSYDVNTTAQISAGLGCAQGMFGIREWVPPAVAGQGGSWKYHAITGVRTNLQAGRKYELAVHIQSSSVNLKVDDVVVCTANLALQKQQRQVGIFCLAMADVTISRFTVTPERPRAFIVMQFAEPYDEVYSHVIKTVCEPLNVEAIRADELYGPGIIIKDIVEQIQRSDIIIADITPQSANVYFEVGYAYALGKPIILLARRPQPGTQLPFDISAFRVLFYDDSIGGKPRLEEGLSSHLREILGRTNL